MNELQQTVCSMLYDDCSLMFYIAFISVVAYSHCAYCELCTFYMLVFLHCLHLHLICSTQY